MLASRSYRACWVIGLVLGVLGACRSERPRAGAATGEGQGEREAESRPAPGLGGVQQPLRATARPLPAFEGLPAPDPLERVEPPEHPSQRLAFSRDRLAWLDGNEVRVLGLEGFGTEALFPAPDARNVVALTGGGFLIAARDSVLRLSPKERRPETFPRAPRIGPTTLVPSRHESEQFWLYYEGIAELPRFDLGAPARVASLPILDFTTLFEFDRRAVLGVGDGSVVYTTTDGLRRIDVEGRREHLPAPELAGRVWALGRDTRLDRVWAATQQHLYLLHVRDQVTMLVRHELPPHPVALGAAEGSAAVLTIEELGVGAARLRVEVYAGVVPTPLVVRFEALAPTRADAGAEPRLEPELSLDPERGLFAVTAFGLHVFDYRRGVRLYPPR